MAVFTPYPNIDDDDFYDKIFRKKEFNKTLYSSAYQFSTTEELCTKGEFKMQNHQEFVRNFISPETPYNGILLFHGTGVGKTCAAIGVTEGLRDYVKRNGKIYILSSENIRPNFFKELYDPVREEVEREFHSMPGSYQCAGDKYYVQGVPRGEARMRAIRSLIKQYYEFFGFGQFANFVDIGLGAKLPSHVSQPKILNEDGTYIDIGDYFANSVIVIDEAHGIAGEDKKSKKETFVDQDEQPSEDTTEPSMMEQEVEFDPDADIDTSDKKTKRAITKRSLLRVLIDTVIPACHAKGTKLKIILLSATPMKDNVRELADLLQLLNVNDGRLEPGDSTWRSFIFPKDMDEESLKDPERLNALRSLARGYISYVKGDNPITFPTAFLPPAEFLYEPARLPDGTLRVLYPYRADKEEESEDISDDYDIRLPNDEPFRFDLVKCPMSIYQLKCYIGQIHGRRTKVDSKGTDSSDTHTRMVSNFVFPHKDMSKFMGGGEIEDIKKTFGNAGFDAVFTKTDIELAEKRKFTTYSYRQGIWDLFGNFLAQDNQDGLGLEIYSRKFNTFLNFVNGYIGDQEIAPSGVIYAYSEFVKAGALCGALVLEANGYVRYTPQLKRHLGKDGLPSSNIHDSYPQIGILKIPVKDRKRPSEFYRCAICGRVYNECREISEATDKHDFKIATYILVTGNIGGIKDIAEATTENMDGSKIKVILGTKATGQGVDLKWVRQVHILDPWHNNTRIYQAIGRGLRHCSHADLPPNKRNVTIYKYASVPNFDSVKHILNSDGTVRGDINLDDQIMIEDIPTGITYRDFLTETVDEHMYHRVVRKDLLIKKIERVLKTIAVDCELNRMRNYFPNSDVDYSRGCDYTLCKYNCEGLIEEVKYIRAIRKARTLDSQSWTWYVIDDESTVIAQDKLYDIPHIADKIPDDIKTNDGVWDWFKVRSSNPVSVNLGPKREAYDLLVDIPLVNIDNSTYDIYFSTPQVDRAVKLITRIYQNNMALTLDKIVYLVRKQDTSLEENFIYVAVDKLVGSPPKVKPMTIIDRYGRQGYLMYHNGFYIYQPAEIADKLIPMQYRRKPLTLKRRYYNMDILAPKEVKKTIATVSELDEEKVMKLLDELLQRHVKSSITDITDTYLRLNKMIPSEHKYMLELLVSRIFSLGLGITSNYAYLLEYYIRTGLVVFNPWDPKNPEHQGIISMIALMMNNKTAFTVVHFLMSDETTRVYRYGRSMGVDKWYWSTVNDIDIDYLTETEVNDIRYPTAPPFSLDVGNRGTLLTYPKLNHFENGMYCFISKAQTHRYARPLIKKGELPTALKGVVKRLQKEYPDKSAIKKALFKIVDQSNYKLVETKAQQKSLRTDLKGLVCSSATLPNVRQSVHSMRQFVDDSYEEYIGPYENMDEESFKALLDLDKAIAGKGANCNHLEKLAVIMDYYQVKGFKWYLNTMETEFYRPSTSNIMK